MKFIELITKECDAIKRMLIDKNKKYGNSVYRPVSVFSKLSPLSQIDVRIDDKINRIANQSPDDVEDTILDLIGYLILRRIIERQYNSKDSSEIT